MFHRHLPVGRRQPSSNGNETPPAHYDAEAPRSLTGSHSKHKKTSTTALLSLQRMAVRFRMLPTWMQIVLAGLFVTCSFYSIMETSSAVMHDLAVGNTGQQSSKKLPRGQLSRNRQEHYGQMNMPSKEFTPDIPTISADEWNNKLQKDRPNYENRPSFRSKQPSSTTNH